MITEESFGRRLRRERERRQIALSSISANTKISVTLFEALEREDVSRWPAGIFRRAFIRAYAENVGLDADDLVRDFLERFPDPAAPPSVTVDSPPRAPARKPALRLTFADAGTPVLGRALIDMRRRLAAAACDAVVVTAMAAVGYVASGNFWLPLAISMLSYYWCGVMLLGNTPGMYVWERATQRADSRSRVVTARRMVKVVDALLVRFNLAASSPDSQRPLRSEPGTSGS